MAVTNVSENDTFDDWRTKSNTISTNLGDASALTTVATNAVGGINELDADVGNLASLNVPGASLVASTNELRRLTFALALAIG